MNLHTTRTQMVKQKKVFTFQNWNTKSLEQRGYKQGMVVTWFAGDETLAAGADEPRVRVSLPHDNSEGTSSNVPIVKCDVAIMDSILSWNKPHSVVPCSDEMLMCCNSINYMS